MSKIINDLQELLVNNGADLVGICSLDKLHQIKETGFNSGISIGVALNPVIIEKLKSGPTRDYYNECINVNKKLNELSEFAARYLNNLGYKTDYWGASDERVDPKTYSSELPHKTLAVLSGIGWIGKCALLVTEKYGSAVRLTSVLSSLMLDENIKSTSIPLCGECDACVRYCPGNAPTGKKWVEGIRREELFDPFKCKIAARQIAKEILGIEKTFCGKCIAVCPYTQRYINEYSTKH